MMYQNLMHLLNEGYIDAEMFCDWNRDFLGNHLISD
jgi:hypothetical protein